MFTTNHFIWLLIVSVTIGAAIVWYKKCRPSLRTVLTVACVVCVISELVKVFSSIEMIPSADGSKLYPYIMPQHIPLHLCSLQLITIFYTRFAKDGKLRTAMLGFMYPTAIAGAFFALMIPTVLSATAEEAFTRPIAYQYFLFHAMLIALGIYIPMSGEVTLGKKQYLQSLH